MSKNQGGFGHIAIILAVVVIAAIGAVGWTVYSKSQNKDVQPNQQANSKQAEQTEKQVSSVPKLQNLGLKAIGPYDKVAGTSGDFIISDQALREYDSMGLKDFYVFGDKVGGKTYRRKNLHFEYVSL